MAQRNPRTDISPEQVIEQLRLLVSQHEVARATPPRFEPIPADEPAPWSVRPPGGFAELRAQLRRAS